MSRFESWVTEKQIDVAVFIIFKVTEPMAWVVMAAAVVVIVFPALYRLWVR